VVKGEKEEENKQQRQEATGSGKSEDREIA
jgi:hypothetical protein